MLLLVLCVLLKKYDVLSYVSVVYVVYLLVTQIANAMILSEEELIISIMLLVTCIF